MLYGKRMKTLPLIIGGIIIIGAIAAYVVFSSPESSQQQTVPQESQAVESPGMGAEFIQEVPEEEFFMDDSLSMEEEEMAQSDTASVSINDEGFSVSTLTVPVGTTVTFTNNGQGMHWPASDPHPTHTNMPGLDPKKALATGESFSYTFNEAGTYMLHDHLAATHKTTIIVQ